MKIKELIRLLEQDGWSQVRMKGSHRQFRHPSKPGTVTVARQIEQRHASRDAERDT
jgi:predicted RNA binding protein YcfA (HicA-like mRNA interferase family)